MAVQRCDDGMPVNVCIEHHSKPWNDIPLEFWFTPPKFNIAREKLPSQ